MPLLAPVTIARSRSLPLHVAADDHALLESDRSFAADVSSQRSFAGVSVALPMGAPTRTLCKPGVGVVSMAWAPPTRSASSSPRGARNSLPRRWGFPTSAVAAGSRATPRRSRTRGRNDRGVHKRLERGNAGGVSEAVIDGVSRALQLDDAEHAHLCDLIRAADAGAHPSHARGSPARRNARPA